MPEEPNLAQLGMLGAAVALLVAGIVMSILRSRDTGRGRLPVKMFDYWGLLLAAVVLVWHTASRKSWLPIESNFGSLICLALILGVFMMYIQRRRPIPGMDWFVLPVVILLLIAAGVFGRTNPHEYLPTAWSMVHRIFTYGGAVGFAIAGATGAMYLVANYRLRNKTALPGPRLGSLERIERVNLSAVTIGFALLTIGAISGFLWIAADKRSVSIGKLILTAAVWVVYAAVLHTPINPSFRGRKTAILSIVGLLLMIVTVVAVQLMPAKS